MKYTYFIEEQANKHITLEDIHKSNINNKLNILCYHINTESKYPFLQFMVTKIPFCNNIFKECFMIPIVRYKDFSKDIISLVMDKIEVSLHLIGCDTSPINDNMYKGIIYDNKYIPYIMVNISDIDISGLNLSRKTVTWFVLPSEIINNKEICNIDIDMELVELFTKMPQLGILNKPESNKIFILPDAVYTGNEYKNVEFTSIFGNNKTKEYDNCGEYYYFYRSFSNAVKEGGWAKKGGINILDKNSKKYLLNESFKDRLLPDNYYGKYMNGGINRYALFVEGEIYKENEKEFSLSDEYIEMNYPEPCIIICYLNRNEIKPDMLVKEYESFVSLSYHKLDQLSLNDKFVIENKNKYMIL